MMRRQGVKLDGTAGMVNVFEEAWGMGSAKVEKSLEKVSEGLQAKTEDAADEAVEGKS